MIAQESGVVEPVTPELCFAELRVEERVRQLATTISDTVGSPADVAIGMSKLITRAAAQLEGSGFTVVDSPLEASLLQDLPVSSLTMLDIRTLDRCKKLGLNTLGDVRKIPKSELHRQFKQQAYRLSRLTMGIDDDPVRALWPRPSVACRMRFNDAVDAIEPIELAMAHCAEQIGADLLHKATYCRSALLSVELTEDSE